MFEGIPVYEYRQRTSSGAGRGEPLPTHAGQRQGASRLPSCLIAAGAEGFAPLPHVQFTCAHRAAQSRAAGQSSVYGAEEF